MLTKEQITKACFNYGYVAVACLLTELEENELFEECQVIKDTLEYISEKYQLQYGTVFNDEMLEQFNDYMKEITGKDAPIENIPIYTEMVKNYLNIEI